VTTGLDFARPLLLAFIFGFSIAIGVSLFVLPLTSQHDVSIGVQQYAVTVQRVLEAQAAYLRDSQDRPQKKEREDSARGTLKSAMTALIGVHDKVHGDLLYARSE
jgi:uncharacterized membrane protein YgaE (UPF0421/DUF939 family)